MSVSSFTSDSFPGPFSFVFFTDSLSIGGRRAAVARHLPRRTLTGADEPQSMTVMSYRSPWEKRGTEGAEARWREAGGHVPNGIVVDWKRRGKEERGGK